jgi:DUF4097 and DUF4098 domain-containing protein YvlB
MKLAERTAFALALCFLCMAAVALAAAPYSEEFDQTYDVAANGRVSLENVNGDVVVTVWDRNAVRVQATKEADSSEDLENLRIEVTSSPSGVSIVTRMPESNGLWGNRHHSHLSVEYTLTVPSGVSLDKIDLVNGSLTVSNLRGSVKAELVNGDVRATALTGDVDLDAVNGTVEVELDTVGNGQRLTLESVRDLERLRAQGHEA